MRPAESKEERSVAVITKQGELHLVTTQNITSGMELTYWADSESSAWTRKNKIDKTSEFASTNHKNHSNQLARIFFIQFLP